MGENRTHSEEYCDVGEECDNSKVMILGGKGRKAVVVWRYFGNLKSNTQQSGGN